MIQSCFDCFRTKELCEEFATTKRKAILEEEEVTVKPITKSWFDPTGKTKLEIHMHNILQAKVEEPEWENNFYAYL